MNASDRVPERARALLDFWFGAPGDPGREKARDIWFDSNSEFDEEVRRNFLTDYADAAAGRLAAWEETPESALALVLLLDQVPRNVFRATSRAYDTDAMARAAADCAMARGFDKEMPPVWRKFFYMPLHHSEAVADQRRCLDLIEALPAEPDGPDNARYARRYVDTISRFGRFPHRNAILGRESTPEEIAFLQEAERDAAMSATAPVLDHVVVDVRDRMDEAADTYRRLGFHLTPRGHHTLGSMNHLAMFATDYLELLGFGEGGANRPELGPFPIGLNGLVFKTADADATHAHAQAEGLPILPAQAFSRPVELDGAKHDVKFRTTRLDPGKVAMGRVYFCEHLTPELVWRPEWQRHPNGACAISRVVVASPDPRRSAGLFRSLFGDRAVRDGDGTCIVPAGAARVEMTTPQRVAAEFGGAIPDPAGRSEYLAALEFTVVTLGCTAEALRGVANIEPRRVVVPARTAFNTTLSFVETA